MQERSYISKITIKGIGCVPIGRTEPTPLCRVYGWCDGTLSEAYDKEKPSEKWTCLTGSFGAENLETGEKYESARLFLPAGLQDILQIHLKKAESVPGAQVKFCLEIRSVKSSNAAGYTYQAVNMDPPTAEADPMEQFRAKILAYDAAVKARQARQIEGGK